MYKFPPHAHQHLFVFLMFAIPTGVRWVLSMVLIYIPGFDIYPPTLLSFHLLYRWSLISCSPNSCYDFLQHWSPETVFPHSFNFSLSLYWERLKTEHQTEKQSKFLTPPGLPKPTTWWNIVSTMDVYYCVMHLKSLTVSLIWLSWHYLDILLLFR